MEWRHDLVWTLSITLSMALFAHAQYNPYAFPGGFSTTGPFGDSQLPITNPYFFPGGGTDNFPVGGSSPAGSGIFPGAGTTFPPQNQNNPYYTFPRPTYSPPTTYWGGGQVPAGQSQTFSGDFLSAHNRARADVGVGPMAWDDQVAAYAQSYANQRSGDCALVHSGASQYGENLFAGSGGGGWTAADAVAFWVAQRQFYDYGSNSCIGGECRHYTQVVWRDSVRLGCARVVCGNGGVFVTCNYSPPGNIAGQRPY